MVNNLRKTVKLRSKNTITFHTTAGSTDMSKEHIAENIDTIVKRIEGVLERGRQNIGSVFIKTTMGPSQRLI
jgi:large subunit ribosomal protein L1